MKTSDQIALAAVVISSLSLIATVVFAFLGRRYTKEQIKQANAQIEETRQQFLALNTPDVELEIYCRLKPPEQAGVYMKATNHHPTIAVGDLRVFATGDSPSAKAAFTFLFLTFNQLKPLQSVVERSPVALAKVLAEHFPMYDQSGAVIGSKPTGGNFDAFPLRLHFSFLPRLHGAQKIEG
ncbi:MAG TPA: hypothetical protein VFL97_10635, partial [Nitrococcus sp.]|nr:hypothetical protein [Nitrococcus sp.]